MEFLSFLLNKVRAFEDVESFQRLQDIFSGVWIERGRDARAVISWDIQHPSPVREPERSGKRQRILNIAFDNNTINTNNFVLNAFGSLHELDNELAVYLRPHWMAEILADEYVSIPSNRDIPKHRITLSKFRDSVDNALVPFILLELAISTGYLTIEVVRTLARAMLVNLFWSRSLCQFVMHYDYIQVRYLAQRVDVELDLPPLVPPVIDPRCEIAFAGFLDQLSEFFIDPFVRKWLAILDDYFLWDLSPRIIYDYLSTATLPDNTNIMTDWLEKIVAGGYRFVTMLAEMFIGMDRTTVPYYGLVVGYWLAKFFGYERRSNGYFREGRDWSDAVTGPGMIPDGNYEYPIETLGDLRNEIQTAVDILRNVWNMTRTQIESSLVSSEEY